MQTREDRAASKARYYRANKARTHSLVSEWRSKNPERVAAIRRKAVGQPEPTRPAPAACESCGEACSSGRKLALDHDHQTGAFRGWLCMNCNTSIGKLGDSLEGVLKAVAYLQRARN